MLVLVSYDVSTIDKRGQARLRKVAKACLDYGQRVQNSVFECLVEPDQWVRLRERLLSLIDPEYDSLRFYFLGSKYRGKIEHIGAKGVPDLERDTLII
ncbi:MAG: CRISPR-associated endonuclease Cas2 [Verrucomicrobia bacterium]|nr:CRISPR-associated endonuclease Cas2 [Verrucomicrobiota bacterium]